MKHEAKVLGIIGEVQKKIKVLHYAPGFNDADGYVVFDIDGNIVSEVAATTSRNASGTVTTIDDNGVVTELEGEDDGSSLSMEGWLPFK